MNKAISIGLSTGPILTIFSQNERYLREFLNQVQLFSILQGTLLWQPILWQNYLPPALITLAFWNGMGYRYVNVCINSSSDASISCKNQSINQSINQFIDERIKTTTDNFVNFGPVSNSRENNAHLWTFFTIWQTRSSAINCRGTRRACQ